VVVMVVAVAVVIAVRAGKHDAGDGELTNML
jgi:hypothetical protein